MDKFSDKKVIGYFFGVITLIIFYMIFSKHMPYLSFFDVDDCDALYWPRRLHYFIFPDQDNGRIIVNSILKFFVVFIPKIMNLHPQNAANTIFSWIYAISTFVLFLIIGRFCYLKDKSGEFFFYGAGVAAIFTASYLFVQEPNFSMTAAFVSGWIFASIFAFTFLYEFFAMMFFDKTYSKKGIIFLYVIALCAGNSSQMTAFTLIAIMFFSLIYKFFLLNRDFSAFKQFIKQDFIKYQFIFFGFGFLLMLCSKGFWDSMAWRHVESFSEIISIIIPFTDRMFDILCDQKTYIISTGGLALLFTIFARKNKQKPLVLSGIIAISVFVFYCSLILAGQTCEITSPKDFWVLEPFYYFELRLFAAVAFSIILNAIATEIDSFVLKNFITVGIIASILFSLYLSGFIKSAKQSAQNSKDMRTIMYVSEKMLLEQSNKDKIILPDTCSIFNGEYPKIYFKAVYGKDFPENVEFVRYPYDNVKNHYPNFEQIEKEAMSKIPDFQPFFEKYKN